jgi:2'-5' RNA ligase
MMRLFIACPLPPAVEEELGRLIFILKQKGGAVKWVAPKNIHLTVRFLGDTDEKLVAPLSHILDTVAGDFGPVDTVVNRVGAFPNLRRPRVIWAGFNQHVDILTRVASRVELAVQDLGFEPESKAFKSHLTLGRVKVDRGLDELREYLQRFDFTPVPLKLDRLTLFKSTLTPSGPIYTCLHETLFKAPEKSK